MIQFKYDELFSTEWISEDEINEICILHSNKSYKFQMMLFDFLKKWHSGLSTGLINSWFFTQIVKYYDYNKPLRSLDFSDFDRKKLHCSINNYLNNTSYMPNSISTLLSRTFYHNSKISSLWWYLIFIQACTIMT